MLTLDRSLAIALALALAERWVVLRMAFAPLLGIRSSTLTLVTIWLWLLLIAVAIVGLAWRRRWGAYSLVALVPVSTILHSIPLVPLVTSLAPFPYRTFAMTAVNLAVLLTVPKLLRGLAPGPRPAAQAG